MNALAEYLENNNLSDSAFARLSKLNQPTVWRIKNGKIKQISPSSALAIEQATGGAVTLRELLFPEQNKGGDSR